MNKPYWRLSIFLLFKKVGDLLFTQRSEVYEFLQSAKNLDRTKWSFELEHFVENKPRMVKMQFKVLPNGEIYTEC